jgi:cell division protein FtsI/penicillin-binding protein 2/cell division protein FtsW (lipid II flippase)
MTAGMLAILASVPLVIAADVVNVNTVSSEQLAIALEVDPSVADRLIRERERRSFDSVARFVATPVIPAGQRTRAARTLAGVNPNSLGSDELAARLQLPRVLADRLVADRAAQPGGRWTSADQVLDAPVLDPESALAMKERLIVRTPGSALLTLMTALLLGAAILLALGLYGQRTMPHADLWLVPMAAIPAGFMLALVVCAGDPLRDSVQLLRSLGTLAIGAAVAVSTSRLWPRVSPDSARTSGVPHAVAAALFGVWLAFCLLARARMPAAWYGIRWLGPFLLIWNLAGALQYFGALAPDRMRSVRALRRSRSDAQMAAVLVSLLAAGALVVLVAGRHTGVALCSVVAGSLLIYATDFRALALLSGLAGLLVVLAASGLDPGIRAEVAAWRNPWVASDSVSPSAQALWSVASGGVFGSGMGLGWHGEPSGARYIGALAENLGTAGVVMVLLALITLVWRSCGIAIRGHSDSDRLLGSSVAALLVSQTALAVGEAVGILPALGTAVPFASDSRIQQVVWFGMLGALLSVSSRQAAVAVGVDRVRLRRRLGDIATAAAVVLLGVGGVRVAYLQLLAGDRIAASTVRLRTAQGRTVQVWNPRLAAMMTRVQRGTILDSQGRVLATSGLREIHAALPNDPQLARRYYRAGRYYPFGASCSGVVGLWSRRLGAVSGIERDLDAHLRGYRQISELLPLYRTKDLPGWLRPDPPRGNDVVLTVNAVLQEDGYRILSRAVASTSGGTDRRAALVVLHALQGYPIVAASVPSVDPNSVVLRLASAQAPDVTPLGIVDMTQTMARAPAGPFKIASALAFGSEGLRFETACRHAATDLKWTDAGTQRSAAIISDDPKDSPHGLTGVRRAVKLSCNVWCARMAATLGADLMYGRMARVLGAEALPPRAEFGQRLPHIAAGTADILVSPMDMAALVVAVTSGKSPVRPVYWYEIRPGRGGRTVYSDGAFPAMSGEAAPPEVLAAVRTALAEVVAEGPAYEVFRDLRVRVAGKTAVAGPDGSSAPGDAWFVGFTPVAAPTFGIACWIERGQSGLRTAAPVVRDMVREMVGR